MAAVPFADGDEIGDGVARLIEAGHLPSGTEVADAERMYTPYPWQPDGYEYRWTITTSADLS